MADLINARFVLGISPGKEEISTVLGLPAAKIDDPSLITADVVVVVASAKTGIDPKVVANWSTFRELYIPTIVVVIDFETGELIPTDGHLAWVSPNNLDALQLHFEVDFDYNYNWEIVDPVDGNNPDVLQGYPPERMALSGNGSEVAYADGTLHDAADKVNANITHLDKFNYEKY